VADILAGFQQDFPVVEDERVVGVLTRADLLRALVDQAEDSPVSNVMRRDFATADVHEMLEAVAVRLSTGACQSLPVTRNGGLVGMITNATEMPPWYYSIMHPDARLADKDRQAIVTWASPGAEVIEPATASAAAWRCSAPASSDVDVRRWKRRPSRPLRSRSIAAKQASRGYRER
jgi:hypothetical protein